MHMFNKVGALLFHFLVVVCTFFMQDQIDFMRNKDRRSRKWKRHLAKVQKCADAIVVDSKNKDHFRATVYDQAGVVRQASPGEGPVGSEDQGFHDKVDAAWCDSRFTNMSLIASMANDLCFECWRYQSFTKRIYKTG